MKALYLTHAFPRAEGDSTGSFVLRLAQALITEDVEVQVVAPSADGLASAECVGGIQVRRFRYAPRRYETLAYTGRMVQKVSESWSGRIAMASFLGANLIAAARARRDFVPDVIHAHWWFPAGLIGSAVSRLADVPLVTTLHGTDLRIARRSRAVRPLLRSVAHHSATVATVSHWLARELRALVPTTSAVVAPMPVDTKLFSPGGQRSASTLLFVGRLNEQKGLRHLIAALPQLRNSATLQVVGSGSERDSLTALAESAGVARQISWLGELGQRDLLAHYREATALVVPSIEEGLGLVAAEALLCETPVVAFASGGLPDVVQHKQTGLLVPVADSAALASAIDTILDNPDCAAKLGCAGRMHVLDTFSPRAAAQRYAGIYRQACEGTAA